VTTVTYYTLALAAFSAINYCLELSHTLHLNTSKLSPRSHSANSLLKTTTYLLFLRSHSRKWTKPANSFAYIVDLCTRSPSSSTVLLRHVSWQPRKHMWRHRLLSSSGRRGSARHGTQKTSYVVVASLAAWRADCCLATRNNIRNSIVACVYSVVGCVT
jgi:hypothetical protein